MSTPAVRRRESISDDSLSRYLKEISQYPLIGRAEEIELAQRIRAGDSDAIQELVCSNLRFVVAIAKKYRHQGVALADLINEGNVGLLKAAAKFDDAKGVRFISYAVWWIRQCVVQAIADHGHPVRVPLSRAGVVYRANRRSNELRQQLGREPTQREVAIELGVTDAAEADQLPLALHSVSLDAPLGPNEDANLLDYLPDDENVAPDEDLDNRSLIESVHDALSLLQGREAQIVRLYFGFDGHEPMTLEAIGEHFGITRERVRQIRDRALTRMRKSDRGGRLAAFGRG